MYMMKNRIVWIKNIILLIMAVSCFVVCRIMGHHLPTTQSEAEAKSLYIRNMTGYLRDNAVTVFCFIFFLSIALTSFLLGYIIYQRFDRNRDAALFSVQIGMFFLLASMYFVTSSHSMFVFPLYRETIGYLAGAALMLMPHVLADYAKHVYDKKAIKIAEWILTVPPLLFFGLGMFAGDLAFFDYIIIAQMFLFISLLFYCAVIHIRTIVLKKTRHVFSYFTICAIQLVLFVVSMFLFGFRVMKWFYLCFGCALLILAFVTLSELLNLTARQYVKSSDAEYFRKMAYIDGLCNIGNRNAFLLEQEGTYHCDALVYVVFDVNNLKLINDRYGHTTGDKIIQKAAEFVSESFESIGKCFRIGGDEFAVIGQYKSAQQVEKAILSMKKEIEKYNKEAEPKLDLAYGYAMRDNTEISTYELFNKADKAMYRYKRRGKVMLRYSS